MLCKYCNTDRDIEQLSLHRKRLQEFIKLNKIPESTDLYDQYITKLLARHLDAETSQYPSLLLLMGNHERAPRVMTSGTGKT